MDLEGGLYAQIFFWTGDPRNCSITFRDVILTIRGDIVEQVNLSEKDVKYFLMNIGNKWEYTSISKDEKDNILAKVESEEIIQGKKYYEFVRVYTNRPEKQPSIYYQRIDEKGLYQILDTYKGSEGNTIVPLPIKDGNSWEVKYPNGVTAKATIETNKDVAIFDRTYRNCIKIVNYL